jgi:hypothetical protein
MLQDKFNDATILVGGFGYTLDELEQNGHSKIKRRYGVSGISIASTRLSLLSNVGGFGNPRTA